MRATRPATPATSSLVHPFSALCRYASPFDRLTFQGHSYGRVATSHPAPNGTIRTEPPETPPYQLDTIIGRTAAPWQAASYYYLQWVAPPGTPIYRLRDVPPEVMLALRLGDVTSLFCVLPPTPTPPQVVHGRVSRTLPDPVCEFARCLDIDPRRTVAVLVEEVWWGQEVTPGEEITVIVLAKFDKEWRGWVAPGDEVVLLLARQDELPDYFVQHGSTRRQPKAWVAELPSVYLVAPDGLHWGWDPRVTIPVTDFRAALAGTLPPDGR